MDPVHFTGAEVLEMAVKIEENGMRFYTDASRAAKTKAVKGLFKTLADEEGKHIKVFMDFKKSLPPDSAAEGFDPYMTEASLYLRAIADTEVFKKPGAGKAFAANVEDETEAVRFAITMEKDSLIFYYELKNMIRGKDRPILDGLIEQEKKHLLRLTDLERTIS